jgi:hypothetical protein
MPPIADASLTSVRYSSEVTYGTPLTGTYKEVRMISESLGQDKEAVQSDEIVTDRRSPDNIQVGSSASGDLVSEVTGGNAANGGVTWDDWWRGSLGATGFSSILGGTANVLFTAGTLTPSNGADPDDIQIAVAGGTPASWPAFVPGEFVYFAGWTGVRAPLNSIYKVKSGGGTNTLVLTSGPRVPTTPGTQAANTLGAFQLQSVTDASTAYSFTIERKYAPNVNDFALMPGMVLTGWTFEMRPKTPCRITWRFLGKEETSTAAQQGSGVTAAITAVKSFSPVTDLKSFSLNENGHDFFVNSFTLDFKNGAYAQDERAGTLGAIGIGQGTFEVTGSYEFYYEAGTLHDQYQRFQDQELHLALGNESGHALCFHLPRVNWVDGRRSIAGKDQAVVGRVDFRAARGPNYLIKVGRL